MWVNKVYFSKTISEMTDLIIIVIDFDHRNEIVFHSFKRKIDRLFLLSSSRHHLMCLSRSTRLAFLDNENWEVNDFDLSHSQAEHVLKVLRRLKERELRLDIDKCAFEVNEELYLELFISSRKMRMNSEKMQIIIDWKMSKSVKEVFFTEFANFYRRSKKITRKR
jgi:hypothetical protein